MAKLSNFSNKQSFNEFSSFFLKREKNTGTENGDLRVAEYFMEMLSKPIPPFPFTNDILLIY